MILQPTSQSQGSTGLEVDFVVRNVYSKIKSLENKYIDLANFYKDAAQSAKSHIPSVSASTIPPQTATQNLSQESSMIRDLIEQKRDLEENIHSLKNAVSQQKSAPASFKSSSVQQEPQQVKKVVGVLCAEIQQNLETAQNKNLQALTAKQNEMFQMASKHKVSSAFRNETLGLWYDAKSALNQTYEDLKEKCFTQQNQAEAQLGVTFLAQQHGSTSAQEQQPTMLDPSQIQTQLTSEIIGQFEYRSRKHAKKLDKLQSHFQNIDQALQSERARAAQLISDLCSSSDPSPMQVPPSSTTSKQSGYLSPFSYSKTPKQQAVYSILSSQQRRSASKGTTQTSRNTNTGYSRSKLNVSADKYQSIEQQHHHSSTNSGQQQQKRSRLLVADNLRQCFEQIQSGEHQKDILSQSMLKVIENVLQQNFVYIQKMQPLANLKTVLPQVQADSQHKITELLCNNEQLFSELRQQNEKYVDLRVENSKLREQISTLQKGGTQLQTVSQVAEKPIFKNFSSELCSLVSQFMHAMRQLQKAVNKKETDVTLQKQSFESAKSDLQSLVATVREYLSNTTSQVQSPLTTPPDDTKAFMRTFHSRSPSRDKKPTVSSTQLNKLPALMQNVKNLQLEKQKLQELVTELKQSHQIEQEQSKQKLGLKVEALQKFAAQCSQLMIKQSASDTLMIELKKSLLKTHPSLLDEVFRLESMASDRVKIDMQKVPGNLRLDPQMLALRKELQTQIQAQTFRLESQVEALNGQLRLKEESLARVKLLFIEKLHELESSFADVTAAVEEVDLQQQSQQQRIISQPQVVNHHLEKSVESVLSKFEQDDRERDLEQLFQANTELLQQNELLKQSIHSNAGGNSGYEAQLEFVIELQEQLDVCKADRDRNLLQKRDLDVSESLLKKDNQGLKYDNKRLQFDLKDANNKFNQAKSEFQAQFNGLKMTIISQKQQLDKELDFKGSLEHKLAQYKEEYQMLRSVKEDLEQQKWTQESLLTQSKDEMSQLQVQLDSEREEMESEVDTLQQQMTRIQETNYSRVEALSSEIIDLKEQLVLLGEDQKHSGSGLGEEEGQESELQALRLELKQTTEELDKQFDLSEQELNQEKQQRFTAEASLTTTQAQLQTLEQTSSDLQAHLTSLQAKYERPQLTPEETSQALDQHIQNLKQSTPLDCSPSTVSFDFTLKLLSATQQSYILQAQQYLKLENDLQEKSIVVKELKDELKEVAQESLDNQMKLNEHKRQSEQITDQSDDATKMHTEVQEAGLMLQFKQKEIIQMTEKLGRMSSEHAEMKTKLTLAEEKVEEMARAVVTDDAQELQQQEVLGKAKELKEAEDLMLAKVKELKRVTKELGDSLIELTESKEQVQKLRAVQLAMKNELDTSNQRCQEAYQKETTLDKKLQAASSDLQRLNLEIDTLKNCIEDKALEYDARLEALSAEKENVMFDRLDKQTDDYQLQKQELSSRIKQLESKVGELTQNYGQNLQKSQDHLEQVEGQNKVLVQVKADLTQKLQLQDQHVCKDQTPLLEKQEMQLITLQSEINQLRKPTSPQKQKGLSDLSQTKGLHLVIALQTHFRSLLQTTLQQTKVELSNLQLQALSLEEQAQQSEFKQVQLEGSLRQEQGNLEKYKKDANFLLEQSLRRQSDMKKTELEKETEQNQMKEVTQSLQQQVSDYAEQVQTSEFLNSEVQDKLDKTSNALKEALIQLEEKDSQYGLSDQGRIVVELEEAKKLLQKELEVMNENLVSLKAENNRLRGNNQDDASSVKGRNSWDKDMPLSAGRGSWGSSTTVQASAEVEEHLKHIRSIMTQFLLKLPHQTKENEDLLPILFSMLNFQDDEICSLEKQRDEMTKVLSVVNAMQQKNTKGGLFGFGKKK